MRAPSFPLLSTQEATIGDLSGLSKAFPANHHVDNGGDVQQYRWCLTGRPGCADLGKSRDPAVGCDSPLSSRLPRAGSGSTIRSRNVFGHLCQSAPRYAITSSPQVDETSLRGVVNLICRIPKYSVCPTRQWLLVPVQIGAGHRGKFSEEGRHISFHRAAYA